jgi:hypothetical protein
MICAKCGEIRAWSVFDSVDNVVCDDCWDKWCSSMHYSIYDRINNQEETELQIKLFDMWLKGEEL